MHFNVSYKKSSEFFVSSFLIPSLTEVVYVAETADIIKHQSQMHMESEATLPDAPQDWSDEKMGDFIDAKDSTEVLCSWEDQTITPESETVAEVTVDISATAEVEALHSWEEPTTAPLPKPLTVPQTAFESVASTQMDMEFKVSECAVEVSSQIKEHDNAQKEVAALIKSAKEESMTELDLAVQAEAVCVEDVSSEVPVTSSEAEPEKVQVVNKTSVLEAVECFETEKDNGSGVPCESSEQGEDVLLESS